LTPSTTQFSWKDRDTAARDLLQLAYHAPPSVAHRALQLLQAIRAPSIVPDLVAIAEDRQRETWQRIHALRAVAHTPGDWHLPQFRTEMDRSLAWQGVIIANHPLVESAYLGIDLLDDIRGLAARHPVNRPWFFAALDEAANPVVVRGFLTRSISFIQPEEFREALIAYLLKFLTTHPEQIVPFVIWSLVHDSSAQVETWLHQHMADIAPILAADSTDPAVLSIAERWDAMRIQLTEHVPNFDAAYNTYLVDITERRQEARNRRNGTLADYDSSPAYRFLVDLYQQAEADDKPAYHRLVRIARKWQGSIPLCAVATHLLGKLGHKCDVAGFLCYLLKYAQDDWDNDIAPHSPVRFEAGDALKDMPSPQVWAEMVDAFFIRPHNVLSDFMLDWIEHVTDRLDGISGAYSGVRWGDPERRGWFRALAEITEEQLQKELGAS
jgi:hypothetical protein